MTEPEEEMGEGGTENVGSPRLETASSTPKEPKLLRRQKTRAMGFLRFSITDMVKPYILNVSDPALAWETLAKVYSTQTIADVMKILNRWENIKMSEYMSVSTFMQYVYDLPPDIVVVHKILKNLPATYEIFSKILRAEKVTPTLTSLASRLHMEEMEMSLRTEPTEEALIFKIKNILREKQNPFTRY